MMGPIIGFIADVINAIMSVAEIFRQPFRRAVVYHYPNESGELVYQALPEGPCMDARGHSLEKEFNYPPDSIECSRCYRKFKTRSGFQVVSHEEFQEILQRK